MTPVLQTVLGPGDATTVPGNCLQAAVASVLDLPLDQVPHFVHDHMVSGGELNWWSEWGRWCADRGLAVRSSNPPPAGELYLGYGPSPRDPANRFHVAVYRDGQLVHDPYPDGRGVVDVETCWVIGPA